LFLKGSMELHVDEIIFILLDVLKQQVRFIINKLNDFGLYLYILQPFDYELISLGNPYDCPSIIHQWSNDIFIPDFEYKMKLFTCSIYRN